jgi:hypothetical protein
MGVTKFTLPPDLSLEVIHQLERISVTSGHDGVPTVCQVHLEPTQVSVRRDGDDSGVYSVPWYVKNVGQIIINTSTLIERPEPYDLQLELARGKVNQLRNQTFEWLFGGLIMPPALAQQIKDSTLAFCRAVGRYPSEDSRQLAESALILACEAADQLIHVYTNQVFKIRQQRQALLDSFFGCRLSTASGKTDEAYSHLEPACNGVNIPFLIGDIAPAEGDYIWEAHDQLLDWAVAQGIRVIGGPLVDFSPDQIPQWLWLWERDRGRIGKLLCEFAADVVERYEGRIRTWQITSGSNLPGALSLKEDELLWLTLQMAETVKRFSPGSDIVVGLSQPWGEYIPNKEYNYSPFVFIDTLLRSGVGIAAIDLEVVMGVSPRGSYCRDLLDFSRLLDFYALLGLPLHITLGYPASPDANSHVDGDVCLSKGHWRAGLDPHTQSDWASEFGALALCKPFVKAVQWVQYSNAQAHVFGHCGLINAEGEPQPVLQRWRRIREKYLG